MTDDAQDAPAATERISFMSRFAPNSQGPLPDDELRARMRTLDPGERKWGFAAGALPLLFALVGLGVHVKVAVPWKLTHGHCLAPGHLTGTPKSCQALVLSKPNVPLILLAAILGIVVLLSVWRSMRVLAIVAALMSGFFSGVLGVVPIFYGGWLLLRSWRLQRYGEKDGSAVRKVATERAKDKREAKKTAAPLDASVARPVIQSKRYTPKAKPRKR